MNVFKISMIAWVFAFAGCEASSVSDDVSETAVTDAAPQNCDVEFMILGVGQDAGAPQIGNPDDPAWADPSKRLFATSAALIDHRSGDRYLFEATPDIREQLQMLDEYAPPTQGPLGLSGVFLTHAHIGHYAGLMFFGRESAGTKDLPVYVMPRMKEFLETNGPWGQLVSLGNVELHNLWPDETSTPIENLGITILAEDLVIVPLHVNHRDEYSETAAFIIQSPHKSALILPDIDSWSKDWISDKESEPFDLAKVMDIIDYAFVDATFYDDNELPGRDMSKIPHPRVTETMDMFQDEPESTRAKIHFIHINHTNPIRYPDSVESKTVRDRGYNIARRGDRICLSE